MEEELLEEDLKDEKKLKKKHENKKKDKGKNNYKVEKTKDNKKFIQKDLEDLNNEIIIIEYNEYFKNNGIIIKQKNICGKVLDMGVLLGESNKKKFIGFQMKYYERGTHLKNSQKLDKYNLKESLKSILLNTFIEMNIKIIEWHYFFCFYFNSQDKDNYNKYLENTCNKYDIEYIIFDPYKEIFYSRDFKPINNEIKLSYRSNLDCLSSSNPYNIFNNNKILEYFASQRLNNVNILDEDFKIFDFEKKDIIDKLKILTKKMLNIFVNSNITGKYLFQL